MKKWDEFYKKNLEWLEKTKENKKNAELQYHEELRTANKEKVKIRDRLTKFKKSISYF